MYFSRKPEKGLPMSSDDIAISVKNLSKYFHIYDTPLDRLKQFVLPHLQHISGKPPRQYYREFWALDNVSFEIKKGESVGIIGRNGSGKSTLLQIICGIITPTSGDVETQGRVAALLELGSGFNPEFTARENVYMNAAILGLSKEEVDARFEDIAAFADIGDFIEQPVKTFSSGMIVRLAFAVIVHVDADILVIDEALSVGDAFFTQKCMRFLHKFMESGTVLFVSHDTGAVLNLCKHVLWLDKGIVRGSGFPKDVTEKYLEDFYEIQQGSSLSKNFIQTSAEKVLESRPLRDMRQDWINQTSLRNDIELFSFSTDAPSFGKGGVEIKQVYFTDADDNHLAWVVGGEPVQLKINCKAFEPLFNPIVGFMVKDRLGQVVFADNTYLTYAHAGLNVSKGERLLARFCFNMPVMPTGDYTVSVAVAEGTQLEHVQQSWVHDALSFKVHSSMVCHGLIGVPMFKIELMKK